MTNSNSYLNHAEKNATKKDERDEKRRDEKKVRKARESAINRQIEAGEQKELGIADGKAEKEEEQKGVLVVHPWHLAGRKYKKTSDGRVVLEDKEQSGVYPIATHSDNITGNGLFRRQLGEGHVLLPETWGDMSLVAKAAQATVGAALGKNDLDTRALVPLIELNLKEFVAPWPGVKSDIITFINSSEYTKMVEEFHMERIDRVDSIVRSKTYRVAANNGYSKFEAQVAIDMIEKEKSYPFMFELVAYIFVSAIVLGGQDWLLGASYKTFYFFGSVVVEWAALLLWVWFSYLYYIRLTRNYRVYCLVALIKKSDVAVHYGAIAMLQPTCSKFMQVPEFLKGWKFTLTRGCGECNIKKPFDFFGVHILNGPMVVPNGCHHDQYNGLAIRYFFDRVVDKIEMAKLIGSLMIFALEVCKWSPWVSYSDDDWLTHLGGKRMRMLVDEPVATNIKYFIPVDLFVKLEVYLGKAWTNFKPRIIQGRRLAYQMIIGSWSYSLSKWLGASLNKNTNFIYDSGLDALELGQIAQRMFSEYKYVYEIDVSNWDGSLAPDLIKWEVWFLETVCPVKPPRWGELKKGWRKMDGVGKNGVKFSTSHGRRSGDGWTSCFNSLINLGVLFYKFGRDILAVAKGDDNYFGTNKEISVEEIVAAYAKIGMKAKVKRVHNIWELGYCSGKFYPTVDGPKWGVAPFRILGKLGLNLHRHPHKLHKQLLFGTALSMLPIGGHVPFLGTMLRAIVRDGTKNGVVPIFEDNQYKTNSNVIHEIHPSAYNIVAERYGLGIEDVEDIDFSMEWNVRTGDRLALADFPLVFDDSRILRGYCTDTDADYSDCSNVTVNYSTPVTSHNTTNNYSELCKVTASAVVEEGLRVAAPVLTTSVLVIAEGMLLNTLVNPLLHLFLHFLLVKWGIGASLFAHLMWNTSVWLLRHRRPVADYGSLLLALSKGYSGTLAGRRPEFFNSMPNCLGRYKHRIIGDDNYVNVGGSSTCSLKMPRRTKQNMKKGGARPQKQSKNKPARKAASAKSGSLGRSLLTAGLGGLGGLLGPVGARIGGSLGDWGANMLGMGDYEVKQNTILSGNGVPSMHKSGRGVRISHREFLGDITGSAAFTSREYVINPGSAQTFPWLSNIAAMFQSYKVHGLIFEFNSTSADALNSVNTALGTVVMATQYNVALPLFTSKAEMEQYEYTVAGRPSKNLIHTVECDPSLQVMEHLYTRTGSLPVGQDYQFYDWGKFQFATVGMQAASTIGELWVSYDIEFLKPRITSGGAWPGDFAYIYNGPYDANNRLGVLQRTKVGNLPVTIVATGSGFDTIRFDPSLSAGKYLVTLYWEGSSAAAVAGVTTTFSNCVAVANGSLTGYTVFQCPSGGASSNNYIVTFMVKINGYSASGSTVQITGGTLPGTPACIDIQVVAVPLDNSGF